MSLFLWLHEGRNLNFFFGENKVPVVISLFGKLVTFHLKKLLQYPSKVVVYFCLNFSGVTVQLKGQAVEYIVTCPCFVPQIFPNCSGRMSAPFCQNNLHWIFVKILLT